MTAQLLGMAPRRFGMTPRIQPNFLHPILQAQSCWYVANDESNFVRDLLRRSGAVLNLRRGNGTSWGATQYGKSWLHNGNYGSLGASANLIASDTQPFTIAWIEQPTVTGSFGLMALLPGGGSSTTFAVLRLSQLVIGGSTGYGALSLGQWKTGNKLVGWLSDANGAPPLTGTLAPSCIIITCAGGAVSQTGADYTLYCGGHATNFSGTPGTGAGNSGAFGVSDNYFGWDNVDSQWSGHLDNLRIWNRVLTPAECRAYCLNPYVGSLPIRPRRAALVAASTFKPWTAMPTGWLS